MFKRSPRSPFQSPGPVPYLGMLLLLVTSLFGQGTTPPRTTGVLFSEVHWSGFSTQLPDYIEVYNLDPLNRVSLDGASLRWVDTAGLTRTFNFPTGGGVPARGVAVLASSPIPGAGQLGITQFVSTSFFANNALMPTRGLTLCFDAPNLTGASAYADRLRLNTGAPPPCPGSPWNGPAAPFTQGFVERVISIDGDSDHAWFDVAVNQPAPPPPTTVTPAPSPGIVNPGLTRVGGFRFRVGVTEGLPLALPRLGPASQGRVPIVSATTATTSAATFSTTTANVQVGAVLFPQHPDPTRRQIRDALFDGVLGQGSFLTTSGSFSGIDQVLGGIAGGSMNWAVTVPPASPTGNPGVLRIDMGALTEVSARFSINPTALRPNLRIERIVTDNQTDATAQGSGELSPVQIDVLPDPGGPSGDVWCELVVYDPDTGFSYTAKVKNWPANPTACGTPNLGMGSPAPGQLDLVALCFNPMAELYLLPTLVPSAPVGSGPFLGINPDLTTFSFLSQPLGIDPAHVLATTEGLYWYSIEGLPSGLTLEAVALEVLGGSIAQFSPVATVTVQ